MNHITSEAPSPYPALEESYCQCDVRNETDSLECDCGIEKGRLLEWRWDPNFNIPNNTSRRIMELNENRNEVKFHRNFSVGTAGIRGDQPFEGPNQYFWELKMIGPVYGTDMMVGFCFPEFRLLSYLDQFVSLLGNDSNSWGYSYTGTINHEGNSKIFGSRFGQGSLVGVHLDLWKGQVSFYKNHVLQGIAFTGLRDVTVFPAVSSTAAHSGMKIASTYSFPTNLQYLCCETLRRSIHPSLHVLDVARMPPGLKVYLRKNLEWLLRPTVAYSSQFAIINNS